QHLRTVGGALEVCNGAAVEEIPRLANELAVDAVFTNRDYEPEALMRDAQVGAALERDGRAFHTFKDHVIFENDEIRTGSNMPFSVFTPYKNAWLKRLTPFYLQSYPVDRYFDSLARRVSQSFMPCLEELGFCPTNLADLKIGYGEQGGRE